MDMGFSWQQYKGDVDETRERSEVFHQGTVREMHTIVYVGQIPDYSLFKKLALSRALSLL